MLIKSQGLAVSHTGSIVASDLETLHGLPWCVHMPLVYKATVVGIILTNKQGKPIFKASKLCLNRRMKRRKIQEVAPNYGVQSGP